MAVDPGQLPRNYRHPPSSWLHRNPEVSAQGNAQTSMDSQTESSDGTATTPPPAPEPCQPNANPRLIAPAAPLPTLTNLPHPHQPNVPLPHIPSPHHSTH